MIIPNAFLQRPKGMERDNWTKNICTQIKTNRDLSK